MKVAMGWHLVVKNVKETEGKSKYFDTNQSTTLFMICLNASVKFFKYCNGT